MLACIYGHVFRATPFGDLGVYFFYKGTQDTELQHTSIISGPRFGESIQEVIEQC